MAYKFISVERKGDIAIITLRKPPENRLNVEACQELIRAYRQIEKDLGQDAEGAVILRGSDAKFFTTGLDLHERDQNIFASSDGFYPSVSFLTVPTPSRTHADLFIHSNQATRNHLGFPVSDCCVDHGPCNGWSLLAYSGPRLSSYEFTARLLADATRKRRSAS